MAEDLVAEDLGLRGAAACVRRVEERLAARGERGAVVGLSRNEDEEVGLERRRGLRQLGLYDSAGAGRQGAEDVAAGAALRRPGIGLASVVGARRVVLAGEGTRAAVGPGAGLRGEVTAVGSATGLRGGRGTCRGTGKSDGEQKGEPGATHAAVCLAGPSFRARPDSCER